MKRALLIGLAAAVLVVALVVALPFLIPLSVYRAQIEQQATRATGRVVKIDGPLRISLFPVLGLRADNTSLASVPGGAHPHLAETESVEVAVALAPLLSGHIEVSQIVLVHPQIHLDVDKAGSANWTLAGLKASSSAPANGPAPIHFVDVKVEDGELTYASAQSGNQRSLDHFNADLNMPAGGKFTAVGSFDQHGKTISFDAAVDNFDAMSAGVESPAHLSFASDLFQAGFAGKVSRDGEADGDLRFETSSLRDVADLFGHPIASGGGLGHFSIESQFSAHNKVYALSGIALSLDTIAAKGALSVDTNGALPYAKGALAVDRLDLNPYLGIARGSAPEPGWSAKPISLSILSDANADLSLSANALTVKKLKISNANLTINLQGGKLDASLDKIALYGGQGQATVTVDSRAPVPTFENHLTFVNIQTGQFLSDTLGVGTILGTGNLRLDVTSRGKSSNDVMHALAGTGAVAIRNGQIHGIDLGAMARTVQTIVGSSAGAVNGVTGFSTFGGNFAISDGVLVTNNLALSGPIITMTGHGAVDLGNRTIDFHLAPKAGIGGNATNAVGVAVPIRVTGTWDHPKYGPDLQGVVSGVIDSIERGGSALKNLFTGGSKSNGQKKDATVGDSVKSLFGIH
jgi:AsmA protein